MHKSKLREILSEHDCKVLESIFDPYQIGNGGAPQFNLEIESEVQDIPEEQTPDVIESARLEVEAIKLAEEGNLDASIALFNQAVKVAKHRGSVYNNRAQALRLQGNDNAALQDLTKAIELCSHQQRTKCQAFCQRGLLHRKMENEDAARTDFEEAAKLGSNFARNQLVELNPYAALCNQMLHTAFSNMQ